MNKHKVMVLGASFLLVALFVGAAGWYRGQSARQTTSSHPADETLLVRPYSPRLGPENAPVTIVEFYDPECEACRSMYPVVKRVMAEFDGQVRLVLRYLAFHKNSAYAISMLESARRQGKYWEALSEMFARQPEWGSHEKPRPELIVTYLKALGLDVETLNAAAKDSEHQSKIQQDREDAEQLGVAQTPTFFVNGQELKKLGYEELKGAVQAALKGAK